MEITKIMCRYAVADRLAMFFFKQHHQMAHPRTLSQYSQTNYCCCKSEVKSSEMGEITDLGINGQFMVFVRYGATEDYVEQFLFCCPLAKHTTKMFKKVDSFTKGHRLSRTHCVSVCADGASGMIRIKRFYDFMKKENKNISVLIFFFAEKKSDSEEIQDLTVFKYISPAVNHTKSIPLRIRWFGALCARWGQNTVDV